MTNKEAIRQLLKLKEAAEFLLRYTHTEEDINLCNAKIEALNKAIDALHSPWINAEEQLPEEGGVYLVRMRGGGVVTYRYSLDFPEFPKIFAHWMPIPELQEGEEDETN